jgi:hypothetical protein
MALSDYDTLALTVDGPCDGKFVSPLGVEVVVYKNWLYVRDPVAWRPGGPFIQSTVMQISEADLYYLDVCIRARRGPQSGVYTLVTTGSNYAADRPFRAMVGCGVVGHATTDRDGEVIISRAGIRGLVYESDGAPYERPPYVGVSAECVAFMREMVADLAVDLPDEHPFLSDELWAGARRFNQGDAFFEEHLGLEDQSTSPGAASDTLASQFLRTDESEN